MLDPRADRLDFCRDVLGLGEGLAVDADTRERLAERTGGDFFDLVFDATGNTAAMEQSFGWVAHGGTLVLVGVVRTDLGFSDPDFHRRELTLKGSRNATIEDFREVLAAIRAGSIPVAAPDHASGQPRRGARALPRLDPARRPASSRR